MIYINLYSFLVSEEKSSSKLKLKKRGINMNNSNTIKNTKTYQIVNISLMAALICILGPLSIPIGLVPIAFTNLAIYISLYTIGAKKGILSTIVYLLVGLAGLPVFSGFSGGPSKLLGPTGGYLIGYIFMAIISGYFIHRFYSKNSLCILGMILGTCVLYIFGTVWLAYQANITLSAALAAGVIPFIAGDLVKIFIAAYIGPEIRNRLIKANLY